MLFCLLGKFLPVFWSLCGFFFCLQRSRTTMKGKAGESYFKKQGGKRARDPLSYPPAELDETTKICVQIACLFLFWQMIAFLCGWNRTVVLGHGYVSEREFNLGKRYSSQWWIQGSMPDFGHTGCLVGAIAMVSPCTALFYVGVNF